MIKNKAVQKLARYYYTQYWIKHNVLTKDI